MWKLIRKVWPSINPTSTDAITKLVTRLCAQNYARYLRVDKKDRNSHTKLHEWWREQRLERLVLEGDTSALVEMLRQCGFVEGQSWHRESERVVLHTASIDPPIHVPRIHSMRESDTAIAERHTRYVYSTPSIANAHDIASRATDSISTESKLVSATSSSTATALPVNTEDDDLLMADVDDADSSDDDYLPCS
jgi:hypothetical protein